MIKADVMGKQISSVRDLNVYKMAFESALEIFEISKSFPREERFSLTDQIRRSSRLICSNLSEARRKRRYIAAFKNKLTDCSSEAGETQTWLEFALKCQYISQDTFDILDNRYEQVFAMLTGMERKAQTFCK